MSANKNISLFIPFVFPNFDEKYVANAFSRIGHVERVDFVAKQDRDGKNYNAVYVHFNKWLKNKLAKEIWEQCFEKNEQSKFYHDESDYFWIVLPNTAKKHVPGERKPRIELGNANVINIKSVENINYDQTFADKTLPAKSCPEEDEEPLEYIDEETLDLFLNPIGEWDQSEIAEIEAQIEADINKMNAEDENLVSIDWRYVHTIEEENKYLHGEIAHLRSALIKLNDMREAEATIGNFFSRFVRFN
jgi:hypothetical protein